MVTAPDSYPGNCEFNSHPCDHFNDGLAKMVKAGICKIPIPGSTPGVVSSNFYLGVAKTGIAPALGAGDRRFKSSHLDFFNTDG